MNLSRDMLVHFQRVCCKCNKDEHTCKCRHKKDTNCLSCWKANVHGEPLIAHSGLLAEGGPWSRKQDALGEDYDRCAAEMRAAQATVFRCERARDDAYESGRCVGVFSDALREEIALLSRRVSDARAELHFKKAAVSMASAAEDEFKGFMLSQAQVEF
ncbi:hypothetical protein NKR23_g3434 [Pleurostoma richardsiae]|uniref:Uncharacterized protein n=1 Tax=Pleurostoma richardsiae TaxID=41990 RepID=A0AA38RMI4_9PEZI|nr:hypothetical protein NKR23_g3434 [Pleurostoma richardsiae]